MESVNLDMGDLFDEEAMDDDDIGAVSALPDLPDHREEEDGEDEDAENTEVLAKLKDLSKGAAKKVVRKPQPKLDASRLTGERGIPVLPKLFEKVKFRGKGHEAEDLALLMRNLEHWAHRLFPKMPFDEVLERAERLGGKREVQTCVKKMRLDMPILNDDFVGSDRDDDEIRQEDDLLPQNRTAQDLEDEWDDLIREAEESQASQSPSRPSLTTPGPSHPTPGPSQNTPGLRYDTPGPAEPMNESQLSTPAQQQKPNTDSPFTPEQLERLERNKQLAREKRLAKMGIRSPASPLLSSSQTSQRGSSYLPVQSSQQDHSRLSPYHTQTSSPTNVNSEQEKSKTKSTMDNEGKASSVNGVVDSGDEEMSEVIGTQNNRVVVQKHQDAQDWCTEPSASESGTTEGDGEHTENDPVPSISKSTDTRDAENTSTQNNKIAKNKKTGTLNSTKSVSISENGKSDINSDADNIDSEEMSEVIPNQNVEKAPLVSKPLNQNTESIEEMSEIIPKQDYKRQSPDSDKENVVSHVNGVADVDETGDSKIQDTPAVSTKERVLKGLNSDMTGDSVLENGTDELNEDELMDTLES